MKFITSSLLLLSLVCADEASPSIDGGIRQVSVMGAKQMKRRTDPPIKGEEKKVVPPPRMGTNADNVNRTGQRGASAVPNYGGMEDDDFLAAFNRDWASRRGVKVDPPKPAEPKAASPLKDLNIDELISSAGLKDLVKPIVDSVAAGENKENIVETLRQKTQQVFNDPSFRQKSQEMLNNPTFKKLADQINPEEVQKQMAGLFGGEKKAGAQGGAMNGLEDLLKGFGAPPKNNAGNNNGWDDLFKGFGGAAPKTGGAAADAQNPYGDLDSLFGDLFKAPSQKGGAAASAGMFGKAPMGDHKKFGSFFTGEDSEDWSDTDL